METKIDIEPALGNTEIAAKVSGIGKRHFLNLEEKGLIGPKPIRLGCRRLYSIAELREWAAAGCPSRENWQGRK